MSLSTRAIAVQGIGFGARFASVHGLTPLPEPANDGPTWVYGSPRRHDDGTYQMFRDKWDAIDGALEDSLNEAFLFAMLLTTSGVLE